MITLIHPSYGRPKKAIETALNWIHKADNPKEVEYILAIDTRDSKGQDYAGMFVDFLLCKHNSSFHTFNTHNCVQSTNEAAKKATGDILVYLSDDFDCPKGWDSLIKERLDIDKPQLLKVDDDLQPFRQTVLTIPIMTRKLYEMLGYFWYPEYESMWVDVDLYFETKPYHVYAKDLVFQHQHYAKGRAKKDATNDQHENKQRYERGQAIFNRRKKERRWS